MSRTTRTGPAEGFWATVDEWAAAVVEPRRTVAWRQSRARLVAECGPYLDLTADLDGREAPARPLTAAVAHRGVPLPPTEEVRAELSGLAYREVTAARRYRWAGPALTPVLLEVHTTEDEGVVEAWWEDVWAAWPTIRLGRESTPQRPPRRATPIGEITRLFAALGHPPLTPPD